MTRQNHRNPIQAAIAVLVPLLLAGSMLISGCASLVSIVGGPTRTATASPVPSETPIPPSPTPTLTSTPTHTPLPTSTFTATPTATWAVHAAEKVEAPILLYHHVNDDPANNRYDISTATFTAQMQALKDWGYTAITVSTLVDVLVHGGPLPARPVVISFDDGNLDVYTNAFPIMQRFGMVGVFFIVGNRVGSPEFVDADQLITMAAAGWEIGSHSWSHIDISQDHDSMEKEIGVSKSRLEEALGVPIKIFAYPFGTIDPEVAQKVAEYGYSAAVGLGTLDVHTWGSLYYLERREVRREYDLNAFGQLLPWVGKP
jgi:peptidoglycan/xylan/chitin deacetylase (PgdA/CDA1 family)